MKKALLCCAIAFTLSSQLIAQEGHVHGPWCASDQVMGSLIEKHPEILEIQENYREEIQALMQERDDDTEIFTIPVVFHVVHDQGPENVSDAQIFRAMQILNEDFRKLNADSIDVIPEFREIHKDSRIQFKLANKAPDGSCTNGINRIRSSNTDDVNHSSKIVRWPRHFYLNIWVVRSIGGNLSGNTLGYATPPPGVDPFFSSGIDGVVVLHSALADIGTANPEWLRTLTHECGHILNQAHTWTPNGAFPPVLPGQMCGDDGIEDTPISIGYFGCPTPEQATVCTPGVVENYQNYMDYANCTVMFTAGQISSMRATLRSPVAGRSVLVSPLAHSVSGIDQAEPTVCSPRVDFYANRFYACVGQEVRFTANVQDATAENFSWSFPGGNASSTNESTTLVSYDSPGWKTVTLTAGNGSGSDTKTNEFALYVYETEGAEFGDLFQENFTDGVVPEHWTISPPRENELLNGINWEWSPVGCLDPGSLKLNLFDQPNTESYRFVTPKVDLQGRVGDIISFKYAYSTQGNPADSEVTLTVRSTRNCGLTGIERLVLSGPSQVLTGGITPASNFAPNLSASLWRTASFELVPGIAFGDIQFEFIVEGDFQANNFYIDNFTISSGLVSTEDINPLSASRLYPNPAAGEANLEITLNKSERVSVRIFDISGKQVMHMAERQMPGGTSTLPIQTGNLSAGIYTVQVLSGNYRNSMKLVVQP